ncbi:unnamed protein product, partial [Allacma fusca]
SSTTLKRNFNFLFNLSEVGMDAVTVASLAEATFIELKPFQLIEDGKSFRGRTFESMSSSFYGSESCAITMKFSNYLDYALTDKYRAARSMMRPSTIDGHTSEVISGVKSQYNRCSLACSFEVSSLLCLIVYCDVDLNGNISFAIGLTPPNVNPHQDIEKLLSTLKQVSNVPEVWIQQRNSTQPINCLTVNLLLRSQFNRNCEYNGEIPLQVGSFQREAFFAADNGYDDALAKNSSLICNQSHDYKAQPSLLMM